jgi:hypothetical protein
MMRPTLVTVLTTKKKSSENRTIRDDFFNDIDQYLKENYSLWLSALPKLKLIKVIDVSGRAILLTYSVVAGWHPACAARAEVSPLRSIC